MKISYNWLSSYIDLSESPEATGEILTSTGLEVEKVEHFETVRGGLAGLVIGQVITCAKHPNADKLSVTTVDVGKGEPAAIVCGAPNVAAGQKVVVALPGTTLYPAKGEPFTIKSTKIRGEKSEGMICAEDEIGLGDNHDGIMVLDTDLAPGTPASEYFEIYEDHVFEIGLTPNRADAFSHFGVARDLKAVLNRKITWPDVSGFKVDKQGAGIPVTVENTKACIRYASVLLTGLTVSESPKWLKDRLMAIGLTPINNVVDVTNYICHEMGQPLHAFNADKISGKKIIVKTLPEGTPFVTLDGKERKLSGNDLMICDERGGLCIAGVFGGITSGVTAATTTVFLESACFSPEYVRKTVLHHQLNTDASFRFARGTDPELPVYALKRAAMLIKELAGGVIASDVSDIYPQPVAHRSILMRDRNVNRLIGKAISREEVVGILDRLDIKVAHSDEVTYTVTVPPYRVDVTGEADVIEEFLRIYGFNNIELSPYSAAAFISEFPAKDPRTFKTTLGEMLVANGFYEMWTNSLTKESLQRKYADALPGAPVAILNKLSEDLGVMRQTLLFSALEVSAHNINRKQRDLRLYEFGKIYFREGEATVEQERLSLVVTGNAEADNWQNKPRAATVFDLLQQIVQVANRCGVTDISREETSSIFYTSAIKLVSGGKVIGEAGVVAPSLAGEFGIRQEIFYAELDTFLLFTLANPKLVIQEVPKYPVVRRDLSLVLDRNVRFEEIMQLAKATEQNLLEGVTLFDVYEGKNIPEGKKAYAITFTLLDRSRTLTDEEIDRTMNRLMKEYENKLGALIRK